MASKLDNVISLTKRRGFVYPSGDIYGGTRAAWDYGPYGVELKENIKRQWWKAVVQGRDDVVGIDSSIILPRQVWVASGHVGVFSDPLTECLHCHKRFRADQLQEEYWDGSLKIDEEKVQNRFFEQTAYVLDLTGETEKENLKELVLLRKLVNEKGKSLSVEESRKIQMQMENITNQRSKLTDMAYLMLFPKAEHEEWAQNLKNHGFYTFLEMPDTERYPWTKMFDLDEIRYALSGAELVKKEED